MSEFMRGLKDFLSYVDSLRLMVMEARRHIRRNIHLFSPEELECMALDNLIDYDEIPEDKRTEFVKEQLRARPPPIMGPRKQIW